MSDTARATACWRRCWPRDGFTANAGALEHRQGFLHVFNGEGNFDAEAILRDWGQPWDIVQPGVAIKQYPCCGSTHPAVDAMLSLVREHGLTPAMVERVEFMDASAAAGAHQPAGPAERARCQVQRAVLPGARAAGSPRVAGAFRGRQLPRSRDPRAAAAHPCRAASRDVDGEHRAFRRRGAGDADGWAGADGEGGAAARARAGRTRCRRNCWRRSSSTARRARCRWMRAERLLAMLRGVDTLADVRRVTDAMVPAALAAD